MVKTMAGNQTTYHSEGWSCLRQVESKGLKKWLVGQPWSRFFCMLFGIYGTASALVGLAWWGIVSDIETYWECWYDVFFMLLKGVGHNYHGSFEQKVFGVCVAFVGIFTTLVLFGVVNAKFSRRLVSVTFSKYLMLRRLPAEHGSWPMLVMRCL